MTPEAQALRYIYHLSNIMENGKRIYPRGMEVKEIADLQLRVNPLFPFMTFQARKYDVNYFKKEMLWKLGASQYDKEIMSHAKMWSNVINPDGTFNSNYGVYWFGPQGGIWSVVTELIRDPDSRRALIPMLAAKHMEPWVVDTVCTEGVGFRIRGSQLDMSVHMRSSDAVFGLGTDIATFTFLYHLVRALVGPPLGGELDFGDIIITAMSSHIYARHYEMVNEIIADGIKSFVPTTMPTCITMEEALYIISKRGKMEIIPSHFNLAKWISEIVTTDLTPR
jgi:thymidylate synthase